MFSQWLGRIRDFWRARHGQTYDGARAEMGGAAWKEVPKSTDAWYVPDDQMLAAARPPGRARMVLLSAAGVAILLCAVGAVLSLRHGPPVAPLVVAPPASPSPAELPVAAQAAPAPAETRPASSPAPTRHALAHARKKTGHHHAKAAH